MSYRIEGFNAAYTGVEILPNGTELPDCDEPVIGDMAVHFHADSGALIEGTYTDLRKLLTNALSALDAHHNRS